MYNDKGVLKPHITFESLGGFLRSHPVPTDSMASEDVAIRAAGSGEQNTGALPSCIHNGMLDFRAAIDRGEFKIRKPGSVDNGSLELHTAADRGKIQITKPRKLRAGEFCPGEEAERQQQLEVRLVAWNDEGLSAEQEHAVKAMANDIIDQLIARLREGGRFYIGGACLRCIKEDNGIMVSNLSKNEAVRALLSPDAMICKHNGDELCIRDPSIDQRWAPHLCVLAC